MGHSGEGNLSVILHGGTLGSEDESTNSKRLPVLREALDAAWDRLCRSEPGEQAVRRARGKIVGGESLEQRG